MPCTSAMRASTWLAITLTAAHPAIASPIRLSHQGRLLDETGAPLEGEHALVLTLTSPDGAPLWTDTFETELRSGYYHLILGSQRPLDGELFRDLAPGLTIGLEGEAPIPIAETLTHVPYAAVAEWAREAHSVRGGVVDASEVRVNGQTVLQAGATTTLGRVRADHGLQLGAAATAACEAGTRGLLRYSPGGPLQVCDQGGWVEVGASVPGTCSIVGECPGGEEPSRVWFDNLTLASQAAVDHLCARYDQVFGALILTGHLSDPIRTDPVEISCIGGWIGSVDAKRSPGFVAAHLEETLYAAELKGLVVLASLARVGTALMLRDLDASTTLPSLQTVGGGLAWTWATGVNDSAPLHDFMPALESVGASLTGSSPITGSSIGPRVPLPSLTTVGGEYYAPSVDAPNLREIGGALVLSGPQPPFPSLEVVGALTVGGQLASVISRIQTPFPLSSLASLRAVQGPLTIHCVRGWSQSDLESFVDRIGRDNIVGPISIVGTESALCVG